jgi:hypothetical protein
MNIDIERVFDYNIINTENITIVNQSRGDQSFLELSLPRLVYGRGVHDKNSYYYRQQDSRLLKPQYLCNVRPRKH